MGYFLSPATGDPRHWGPATWDYLFIMASHFPHSKQLDDDRPISDRHVDTIRKVWKRHIASLLEMLPCNLCRNHFEEYINKHPLESALVNRDTLFEWLWNAKAEIRKSHGKKVILLSTVKRRYIPKR